VGAGATDIAFYQCDLTDFDAVDALVREVLTAHGGVDILINNAGRSIRRSVANAYERFHDFERTMRLNYFGALRITLQLLPVMQRSGGGHIVNISSIGVLTNAPRFSAYVASKAAMDAFAHCAAAEFSDDGIAFTTVYMPLVRSTMTAPTDLYRNVPMLSTDEAAELVAEAIIHRRERVTTGLGSFALALNALAPRLARVVMSVSYRMFGESAAARIGPQAAAESCPQPTPDQVALTQVMRGMHF
jgi:NAD(P)-dependent dehydrogenase (short-subunit alcohol dehydrogenase family)